jgi:hypothetical protein
MSDYDIMNTNKPVKSESGRQFDEIYEEYNDEDSPRYQNRKLRQRREERIKINKQDAGC